MLESGGILAIKGRQKTEEILIEVSDTGCGIRPEDLNKIFLIQRTAQAKRIGLIAEMGEDSPIGAGSAAEEEAETIATVVADLYTGIKNAQDTYHEGMRDAERDFWRNMAQINLDAQRAIDESWIDDYASAYEIARRMNDDFIREDIDYAAKVRSLPRAAWPTTMRCLRGLHLGATDSILSTVEGSTIATFALV